MIHSAGINALLYMDSLQLKTIVVPSRKLHSSSGFGGKKKNKSIELRNMENSDCREQYESLEVNMAINFILFFSCACSLCSLRSRCKLASIAVRI